MTYLLALLLSLMFSTGVYVLAARRRHARRFRLHQRLAETLLPGRETLDELLPPNHEPKLSAAQFFAQLRPAAARRRPRARHLMALSFLFGVFVSLVTSILTVSLLVFIAIKTCGR